MKVELYCMKSMVASSDYVSSRWRSSSPGALPVSSYANWLTLRATVIVLSSTGDMSPPIPTPLLQLLKELCDWIASTCPSWWMILGIFACAEKASIDCDCCLELSKLSLVAEPRCSMISRSVRHSLMHYRSVFLRMNFVVFVF